MINSREDAYEFLEQLKAPEHLKAHVKLVGEAADILIETFQDLQLQLDYAFIRTGVAIHDLGKIKYLNEMSGPGSEHETEGEKMLLEIGVSEQLARVCISHARWEEMECSIEELIIALSDKLWKGKRVEALELEVIDRAAELLKLKRWDLFSDLDFKFEAIAAAGDERLQRSIGS